MRCSSNGALVSDEPSVVAFDLRWTPSAFRDLTNAHEVLKSRNPAATRSFADRIRRAVEQVRHHPESGPVADDIQPVGDYRHVVVRPHRIIYMVDEQVVVILRIWDSRRNPADLILP